jgi:PAS domain S-box-containing protein
MGGGSSDAIRSIVATASIFEAGLEGSDIAMYISDRDDRILYMSPAIASFLNIKSMDVIGRTDLDIGLDAVQIAILRHLRKEVFRTGKALHEGIEVPFGSNHLMIEHMVLPIFDAGGEVAAVVAVMIDRTPRVRENKVLESLVRIDEALRATEDTKELIARVVKATAGCLGDDAFALIVHRGEEWMFHHSLELKQNDEIELGKEAVRLAAMSIDSSEVLNIKDATEDRWVTNTVAIKYCIHSALMIPLWVGVKANAALIFIRFDRRPFSQREVELGQKIATSLAVAINDQILLEEVNRVNQERERLLVTIDRERERYARILDASPVAIALFESTGTEFRLSICNKIFEQNVLVSTPRPLEGKSYREMLVPEELAVAEKLMEKALRTGRTQSLSDYVHHTGERSIPSHVMITPLTKRPPSFLMAAVNTTELVNARKQVEELAARTEEEKARLRTMIDNLPVGILLVGEDGQVLESNRFRQDLGSYEVPRQSLPGDHKRLKGRWSNTGIPISKDDWPVMRALKKGEIVRGEMIDVQFVDGRHGTDLVSAAPIKDDKGRRIGAVLIVQDITEQRRLEQDAIEAKERAEMYLDLITQDISCHNSTISKYIQLAMAKDKLGKRKDDLQRALEAVNTSSELVDTVRKIQLVETHDASHGLVELTSLVDDIITEVRPFGGTRTTFERVPHHECFIHASPMLKEAFLNVLINAIKHSEGDLRITIRQNHSYYGGREYHKVIIEDNGPGIPDDIKPKVFLRKYRGRTKAQGSGLGLYLTKRLVEEHGGKIWIEDRVSGDRTKGAKFIIHLPAVAAGVEPDDP